LILWFEGSLNGTVACSVLDFRIDDNEVVKKEGKAREKRINKFEGRSAG